MAAPVGLVTTAIRRTKARQRPFAGRVEQPFPGQFLAQLPQGQFQRPHSLRARCPR